MLFFKRILNVGTTAAPSERRNNGRFAVKSGFPAKTVLNIIGRDESGQSLKPKDGKGWDWTGRLLDVSYSGARIQLPPTVLARRGDACDLKILLEGYELHMPAMIAHISQRRDSFVFGLTLNSPASPHARAFRQLVELIAIGATMRPGRPLQPDASGYLVEEFVSEPDSRLLIWRHFAGREVAAFEFQLKDSRVRGEAGRNQLEYLTGSESAGRPASKPQGEEILRLYQWVVSNLAASVPADVSDFLRQRAA